MFFFAQAKRLVMLAMCYWVVQSIAAITYAAGGFFAQKEPIIFKQDCAVQTVFLSNY